MGLGQFGFILRTLSLKTWLLRVILGVRLFVRKATLGFV